MSDDEQRLPYAIGDEDDVEVLTLIDSWRYRGPAIGWDAIVGHQRQVRRCQEIIEALHRPDADLERLRIRLGRGLVISGPPGTGKTLIARATAGSLDLDVIAPPVSELTPGLVARLYAQLHRGTPVVVVLDEAEPLVCAPPWSDEPDLVRALCVALDGIEHPTRGSITIALVTASEHQLSPLATRPGRLSPRLDLGLPSAEERGILLDRAVDGLPVRGTIDRQLVIERTGGWSGAEIAVAIEEAMSRSLLDGTDALTPENLLAIVSERYVIADPSPRRRVPANLRRVARHEASHCLWADTRWPGQVAMVTLGGGQSEGWTRLDEDKFHELLDGAAFRDLAGMALAGVASELLWYGVEHVSEGTATDRESATSWLIKAREVALPYDPDVLERGHMSDRGSERMRAAIHAAVERDAAELLTDVIAELAPHRNAIDALAQAILEADDSTLSGDDLNEALRRALESERRSTPP